MTDKNKKDSNDFDDGFDNSDISNDVMESCSKMLENLSKNPNLINKTVKNFMQTFSGLQDSVESPMDESDSDKVDEILVFLKRILSRIRQLEKRMEKAGLIKPVSDD